MADILQRPVMSFVLQWNDLESLQVTIAYQKFDKKRFYTGFPHKMTPKAWFVIRTGRTRWETTFFQQIATFYYYSLEFFDQSV